MSILSNCRTPLLAALAVTALTLVMPVRSTAQDHPQEVLDLISAHDALDMKIRALQKRVSAPMPSSGGADAESVGAAEKRVPDTLRHRDRATTGDDLARIRARLAALQRAAVAERNRVEAPGFGEREYRLESEPGSITFGDGQRGRRLPTGASRPDQGRAGASELKGQEIAEARRSLAELERGVAALERELEKK